MKTLPVALQSHLDTGVTTLCWCWKVTRADLLVQGFTNHDKELSFDSVTYQASSGFTGSEIQSGLGLSIDNMSAMGALSSESLNEDDLAAGLYDNADIEVFRVNWRDTAQRILIHKGTLGEVSRGRSAFQAEVRGIAHYLNQPVGRAFGRLCDADLGDGRCGIDLEQSAFKGSGTVTSIVTARRAFTASGLNSFASQWFSHGLLTWTSGANAGRSMEVKQHGLSGTTVTIELWQEMSEAFFVGETFTLTAGCDKDFETCKTKFSNTENFRGFPYMPGNDVVTSYPAKEDIRLDGGSRYGN